MEQIKLESLAQVIGGKNMSRFEPIGVDDISVKIITSKTIEEGLIIPNEIGEELFRSDILKDKEFLTKIGDILIKLTSPFDAAIVTEEFEGCTYPAFVACIRPNAEVTGPDIYYLLAFLNSKEAKARLNSRVVGRTLPVLSLGPLREMMIPFPGKEVRKEIASSYMNYLDFKLLTKKIFALEKEKNDSYFGKYEESDGNYHEYNK